MKKWPFSVEEHAAKTNDHKETTSVEFEAVEYDEDVPERGKNS